MLYTTGASSSPCIKSSNHRLYFNKKKNSTTIINIEIKNRILHINIDTILTVRKEK